LNKHSDQHILDAIKQSKIRNIYVGIYSDNCIEELKKGLSAILGNNKTIKFFDSQSAITWQKPAL